ncbi:sigma-70 family RNA polymerase sigma factor [Rhodopirellula sp. SWK7]|uniref:sigma-70 family RNA polymerase sigma factor n=1 Tax=Rhodopirellula sp. SWK7 TaxID=595460 RepID=UPI0005C650D5|nr:sigma-70 family RNA polymerase sigma factor [Rhodopirellula sp. SWK7]
MLSSPSEFDDLLQQAQRPVLGYLIRLTGSLHAAQDLLQSANVTAIEKRSSFAPGSNASGSDASGLETLGSNFVAWLRQIALNHYRNYVRKESAARRVSLVDEDLHELIEQRYRERTEQKQQDADWHQATQCLQQLPDYQREVMTQFYLHGQTIVQLAESTGRKPNAIGQTLYRARLAVVQCVKHWTVQESNAEAAVHANPISGQNLN